MAFNLCFVNKDKFPEKLLKVFISILLKFKPNYEQLFSKKNNASSTENDDSSLDENCNDLRDLIVYNDGKDPFLDKNEISEDSSDENIIKDDNIIISSSSQIGNLNLHVYNKRTSDFYLHSQITTEDTTTAMEWLNFDPVENSSMQANILATGNESGSFQLWDLDIMDSLECFFKFGQPNDMNNEKIHWHTDAVTALKWNHLSRNIIVSGSIDERVIIWDLATLGMATRMYRPKKGIIRGISWHPSDKDLFAVLCSKKCLYIYDCRSRENSLKLKLPEKAESISWSMREPSTLFLGCESGNILHCDVRNLSVISSWKAHNDSVCDLCPVLGLNNSLASCSDDNTIKLWNTSDYSNCVYKKKFKDSVISLSPCMDEPGVIAYGLMNDIVNVLDFSEFDKVKKDFGI